MEIHACSTNHLGPEGARKTYGTTWIRSTSSAATQGKKQNKKDGRTGSEPAHDGFICRWSWAGVACGGRCLHVATCQTTYVRRVRYSGVRGQESRRRDVQGARACTAPHVELDGAETQQVFVVLCLCLAELRRFQKQL